MPKENAKVLFYDHMPKPDAALPPIREPNNFQQESRKLSVDEKQDEKQDFLSNISFQQI